MEHPGTSDTALTQAHRRLIAERLPLFTGGWLAATIFWVVVVPGDSSAAPHTRLLLCGAQGALFAVAALLGRCRPPPRQIELASVVICIATALAGTAFCIALGTSAAVIAMLLFAVVVTSSLLFAWRGYVALLVYAATWGPWMLVRQPWPALGLTPIQCVAGAVVGAAVFIVIGEAAFQSLRTTVEHEVRQAVQAAALQTSRDSYRALAEDTVDLIWTADLDWRFTYANAAAARHLGMPADEVVGLPLRAVLTSHPVNADLETVWTRIAGGYDEPPRVLQVRPGALHREPRWFEVAASPVHDPAGRVMGIRGMSRDVTDRVRTEERLRESEARFRSAFGNASVGMLMVDMAGRPLQANPVLTAMLGYREDELQRMSIFDLTHPDDHAMSEEHIARLLGGEIETFDLEKRYLRKDGQIVWGHVNASLVKDEHGTPVYSLALIQDVTAQHQTVEALRASERRYRGLVESQQALIVRCTADGILNFINDAYCAKFGRPRAALLGASFVPLVHEDDLAEVMAAFARIKAPPYRDGIVNRGYTPEGLRWFEWELASVRDEDGATIEIQAIGRDVTARKEAEDALHASLEALRASEQKLRRLAHGQAAIREAERKRLGLDLHDDVCQELVGVGILIESVCYRLGKDAAGYTELRRAAGYVGEVVEHLRKLARELRPLPLRDLGLESAIRSLAAGVAPAETRIDVEVKVPVPRLAEETEVMVYRTAHEAITNAVRHAAAGTITVRLDVRDAELTLEVRDDGKGFDVGDAHPSALGLASMEERAIAHGGRLTVQSQPGKGTCVALTCGLHGRASVSAA
jgi:PAS domain S-box-containing protein